MINRKSNKLCVHSILEIVISAWIVIMLSVIGTDTIKAQDSDDLEKQYYFVSIQSDHLLKIQDSLKLKIEEQIRMIDLEKQKSDPDPGYIQLRMADIIDLRKQLKEVQKKNEKDKKKLLRLRDQLQLSYQRVMDSLLNKKSETDDLKIQQELDKTIAFYLEKRLILTPVIQPLSFSWNDLEKIDLSRAADSLELQIQKEFISMALQEMDERIDAMKKARAKYDDMISFHQKLETFSQDMEMPFFRISNNLLQRYSTSNQLNYNEIGSDVWKANVQSLTRIFVQLHIESAMLKKMKSGTVDNELNYEEFIQLIKIAEQSLIQYRKIIQKKIKK